MQGPTSTSPLPFASMLAASSRREFFSESTFLQYVPLDNYKGCLSIQTHCSAVFESLSALAILILQLREETL
jgi:hypothetical protein